ncbi:hypothetical protein GCM10022402_27420 [Salinactinospora qingdaonensis]|uniref:Transposase IS701-like DDE domain-containing protein n=1 Tax=Salinactinospora qingdaonensis TaxID=702744 RepID=A0ABP7FSU6_9ACTN
MHAWVLVPVFIPKRGAKSAGVHKAFVSIIERALNCQIGIGLFPATADRTIPVDWRLMLPRQWLQDAELCRQARIPEDAKPLSLWSSMLDLRDTLSGHHVGSPAPLIAKVCTPADARGLVTGLTQRQQSFTVTVPERVPFFAGSPFPEGARGSLSQYSALDVLSGTNRPGTRHHASPLLEGPADNQRLAERSGDSRATQTHRLFAE